MPAAFERSSWLTNFDQDPICMDTGSRSVSPNTWFTIKVNSKEPWLDFLVLDAESMSLRKVG
jgi:hypothetical protein